MTRHAQGMLEFLLHMTITIYKMIKQQNATSYFAPSVVFAQTAVEQD